jgi:hypothetical protein
MASVVDHPLFVFIVSFFGMMLFAKAGAAIGARLRPVKDDERQDLNVVLTSTLTLLGLIIGFSFSMVVTRYDLRKSNEEEEANAIGTEYARTSLLPAADAAQIRELLLSYLDLRVRFYTARDARQLQQINASTTRLQLELWSAASTAGTKTPSILTTQAVLGMNTVLNSEGYTQAAWWNRLPRMAWCLMAGIALFCNFLFGFGSHHPRFLILSVLPLSLSLAFFLIAEIDSPRDGFIRVLPQNLLSLSDSLRTQ